LLRETEVYAGVLVTDDELRLIYAPRAETSGWIAFPFRPLGTVAGRPMLGGLKLALGTFRLFNDSAERRLPALLRHSREAQATVSGHLSAQVLGALHDLLRGLYAAEPKLIGDLAASNPQHLYEGLLAVLMRLVFILYAEDRDLIPSKTGGRAREVYERGYSLRGLYAKLTDDEAHYPDTMNERVGGWGRLLALFRLVHAGHASGWIRRRGGKLFNPNAYPFLEGRGAPDDSPRVLGVSDGALLRILRSLMVVDGERLSYRTLDVQQIGSVYETVMGFTVEKATGQSLAIRAGKNNKVPVFVDLASLLAQKSDARLKSLKKDYARAQLSAAQKKAVKDAKTIDEMADALDSIADERGSPGRRILATDSPILQPTDERRRTGSHYTPRSLTEPIVRHALEPAFQRLGPDAKPDDVLAHKVCDPAMGSGAFLVEACRLLAARLVQTWARWPETKPTIPPDEDDELHARRLVAQRCLYGVDKNHMATDLAKLSLWLATLARDHEFTFLDHALRTGDSLVGLSRAQLGAMHWDPSYPPTFVAREVDAEFKKAEAEREKIRASAESKTESELTPLLRAAEGASAAARLMGDAIIACYFSQPNNRSRVEALVELQKETMAKLSAPNWSGFVSPLATTVRRGEHPIPPFHWELEFPEVFDRDNPGFDAIVGNPPFAGKNTIAAGHRTGYPQWLQTLHVGAHGNADLVAHFYRRAFTLLRTDGSFGLIATNTICQGDTRATGLTTILGEGGAISRATRRLRWPGEAAVVVSVVHIQKGTVAHPVLDGRPVPRISAYLVEDDFDTSPAQLAANARKAFQGSIVLGMGFTFDDEAAEKGTASSLADMQRLVARNPRNSERILPYIGGEEVNNDPRHAHRRWVISFGDMTESEVRSRWPDLIEIVERLVKPQRDLDDRPARRERWWRFGDSQPGLYRAIADLPDVLVTTRHAPHLIFAKLNTGAVFAESLLVFALASLSSFAALQCRVHEVWARFFASSMKDDLRYTPSDCFSTFPFPENLAGNDELEAAGHAYYDHRAALMVARNEGLTKTYNRLHRPTEKNADIAKLRALHAEMDAAVLRAYGWDDLAKSTGSEFIELPTDPGKNQNTACSGQARSRTRC
jgi:N-6 DNA Methylase